MVAIAVSGHRHCHKCFLNSEFISYLRLDSGMAEQQCKMCSNDNTVANNTVHSCLECSVAVSMQHMVYCIAC